MQLLLDDTKIYLAYFYEERLRKEELVKLLTWGSENPDEAEKYIYLNFFILVVTIVFFLRRYRWRRKQRKELEKEVRTAKRMISNLQEKIISLKALEALEANGQLEGKDKKEVRIWLDGAFDMMHYGHANAFRKGKILGTYLIVGVNSDESIAECKGPPVLNDEERMAMVQSIKWVDEVVANVPYVLTDTYLYHIIDKYKIDYVVHGDDPVIVNGKDAYGEAKKMGKYKSIPRTDGVSTTDIVGRMLLLTSNHHDHNMALPSSSLEEGQQRTTKEPSSRGDIDAIDSEVLPRLASARDGDSVSDLDIDDSDDEDDCTVDSSHSRRASTGADIVGQGRARTGSVHGFSNLISHKSNFMTTSHILRLFSAGVEAPLPGMTVVYVAGAWDMFHAGHVATLRRARALGDYLVVGIHSDYVVNKRKGSNLPIMSMQERVLSVLSCKFCDDVLLDAPYQVTAGLISHLGIDKVCATKKRSASTSASEEKDAGESDIKKGDPYAVARDMGVLVEIEAPEDFASLSVYEITHRIHSQRERYQERFARKKKQEDTYYANKFQ